MTKITESIQKLSSIKQQLVSITNRVNALKKATEPVNEEVQENKVEENVETPETNQ